MSYERFIGGKLALHKPSGITGALNLPASLFKHQDALTSWALRRGRSAIFADTGLGKSRMEAAWADAVTKHTRKPVIVLAPVAVAQQTKEEGAALGIDIATSETTTPTPPT